MKYTYIILIAFFWGHIKGACQITECSHVYSNMPGGLELTGIERTDLSTTLHFCFSLTPGDMAEIPSTFYLSDEQGRKYPITGSNGIDIKNGSRCGLSEKINFTLTFPPLPEDVKIFDLKALNTLFNAYCIWGIHDSTMPTDFIDKIDIDTKMTDSKYIKSGTCVIEGRIRNAKLHSEKDSIRLNCIPLNTLMANHLYAHIGQDSTFHITANLDATTWTYLEYRGKHIPVFLIPSDTLEVNLEGLFTLDEKISYRSRKNYNIMPRLLEGDPIFASWDLSSQRAHQTRPSEMMTKAKTCENEYARMARYMAWKHHMNTEESHLLYSMMHSIIDDYLLSCASITLQALLPHKDLHEMSEQQMLDIVSQDEMDNYLSFMEKIEVDDYAHFIVPNRYVMRAIHSNYLKMIAIKREQSYKDLLEKYMKQQINEEWLKRIQ